MVSIRLLFGGDGTSDSAEVQIDGAVNRNASDTLLNLRWPRPDGIGSVKAFVLSVHRDDIH